ncbi:polysaccharide deacetylase [Arthrobacter sp. MYb224]|uniref:polysaccharide deacetylase family protein n=1 Tax=Arthrobacter sp. MYb224 TaxID=1848600 RepID=UPI000CFD8D78|nr:polysaccharide deacetylase family protein [Arthrobacter sp. MYb224]PQZ98815.1 polysaccharide deacetylase [Arthrobacter sp. MYb224]
MSSFSRRGYRFSVLAIAIALLAGCAAQPAAQPTPAEPSPAAVDCAATKCAALTFDDGPGEFTDRLLDELGAQHTPATFFVLGKNVKKHPKTLERMAQEGHQIGSHTFDHKDLTTLTADGIEQEVQWTAEAIEEASGVRPDILRPPYGSHGAVYDRLVPYPLVLWDVDTMDWQHHDPEKTVEIAMEEVNPGSIILMHDIHESSVQAVPQLVEELRQAGYTLVTVEQLFAGTEFKDSKAYAKRSMPHSQ